VTSHSFTDQRYDGVYHNFNKRFDNICEEENIEKLANNSDVIFIALPHGIASTKITKEILQAYSAADHSAYGNGGNFDKMPHPFGNYDETKYEIILVDNDTIAELKAQVTEEKSLLTLVNEFYKPEMSKEEVYKPLHSGKYINENNKQVKQLVETIPSYIKCRKLIKMNQGELNAKAAKRLSRIK